MQTLGSSRWPGCSRTKFGLPAQALTIPLDTAKVRLQIQGKVEGIPKYRQALPLAVEQVLDTGAQTVPHSLVCLLAGDS